MPVAESFKEALGRGNGFPSCIRQVDVDNYDWWTTASGFNKGTGGSPSAASINESLRLAMKWFWNLHRINGFASEKTFSETHGSYEESSGLEFQYTASTWTNYYDQEITDSGALTPKKRICLPWFSEGVVDEYDIPLSWEEVIITTADDHDSGTFFRGGTSVSALYSNGELMGYGIGFSSAKSFMGGGNLSAASEVNLTCYSNDVVDPDYIQREKGYAQLDEFHFVANIHGLSRVATQTVSGEVYATATTTINLNGLHCECLTPSEVQTKYRLRLITQYTNGDGDAVSTGISAYGQYREVILCVNGSPRSSLIKVT